MPRVTNYLVVTKDGASITGVLLEEGSTSLTLVGTNGERHVVLRSNIDEMSCTGKSLMPDGLEKELSRQDMADLIAYLAGYVSPR